MKKNTGRLWKVSAPIRGPSLIKDRHHLPYSTDHSAVYCVPGSTSVPQNPMNVMVMVMVKVMVKSTA